nr:MAG: ORF1 [Benyviridae sp.]
MDVQTVIDTAICASATTLGAAEAANYFRETLKSSYKVYVNLKPNQQAQLRNLCRFPIVFSGGKTVTNDHPLLVALRDLCREVYERDFKISATSERTLVVGAAMREITKYNNNPNIHYYVYGGENKDYDRIVRPALSAIVAKLRVKALKTDRRVFLGRSGAEKTAFRPCLKRYYTMEKLFKDYVELAELPSTIHTSPVTANTLLFEDSIYNFDSEMIAEIFQATKANIAYGYAMLPMELIFPDLPENDIYVYTRTGSTASMTFCGGYCNGYEHNHHSWGTLLRQCAYHSVRWGMSFAVEITTRIGPACVFKIYRCPHPERICRTIELTPQEQYVRVLDIMNSVNKRTGKASNPLTYFSVNEEEFYDVLNYVLSVDPKSQTFQTILTYIRRRMGGVSLVTKELVQKWSLPKHRVHGFCLLILVYVKVLMDQTARVVENLKADSIYEKFARIFRVAVRTCFLPIAELLDWIYAGNLTEQLVLLPPQRVLQRLSLRQKTTEIRTEIDAGLYCDLPNEEDIPICDFCCVATPLLGKQRIICEHKPQTVHTFALTQAQIDKLSTDLIDNDNDPVGLKKVKERAQESMPKQAFQRACRVHYVQAGPGCGKSYLIRKLATEADLVLAPFTKLMPDYKHVVGEDGIERDLLFKTTHRAMSTRGCARIFVDEFASMPYEYLACIVELNGATDVYLVGDTKQSKVREPDEGMYIGNYIDLATMDTHTLVYNFRNPKDTVALLNRTFGYTMIATSQQESSIRILPPGETPEIGKALQMAFSANSAEINTQDRKNTVRANQGGTTDDAILYINSTDGVLPTVEELQIVAISRHRTSLTIVTDGSETAQRFIAALNVPTDAAEIAGLAAPDLLVEPVVLQYDPLVDSVLPGAVVAAGMRTSPVVGPLPGAVEVESTARAGLVQDDGLVQLLRGRLERAELVVHLVNDFVRRKRTGYNYHPSYNGFAAQVMNDHVLGPTKYRELLGIAKETNTLSDGTYIVTTGRNYFKVLNVVCNADNWAQKLGGALKHYTEAVQQQDFVFDAPLLATGLFGRSPEVVIRQLLSITSALESKTTIRVHIPDRPLYIQARQILALIQSAELVEKKMGLIKKAAENLAATRGERLLAEPWQPRKIWRRPGVSGCLRSLGRPSIHFHI